MLTINIKSNLDKLTRSLTDFAERQVPFAIATALTGIANKVAKDEAANMVKVLNAHGKPPTPFTLRSIRVKPAKKTDLAAEVILQDIAAKYLEPFEFGGNHKLIGKGLTWLNPKDFGMLNKYGNFPKSKLAALKGNPNVFIGTVKPHNGAPISGVWLRPPPVKTPVGTKAGAATVAPAKPKLKLLIRFGDAEPVKQRLRWRATAQKTVSGSFAFEFGAAVAKARATAK